MMSNKNPLNVNFFSSERMIKDYCCKLDLLHLMSIMRKGFETNFLLLNNSFFHHKKIFHPHETKKFVFSETGAGYRFLGKEGWYIMKT